MSLFLKTSQNNHFIEHHHYYYNDVVQETDFTEIPKPILFLQNEKAVCFEVNIHSGKNTNQLLHWCRLDNRKEKAIYIEPKLNNNSTHQTDYLKMLFSALKHTEVAKHTDNLFEIKWDKLLSKLNSIRTY